MTATMTPREQLEKLTHDMQSLADECDAKDGGASAEDLQKLNDMGADVLELVKTVKAQATANGTIDVAKAFLGDLAKPAGTENDQKAPGAPLVIDGIVDPKGMTLGEAFVKSPAYMEFVDQYKGADGSIRQVRGIKSAEFNVLGGALDSKTLVTGASSTSGGAFVVNERLGVVGDNIGQRRLTVRDLCTVIPISSDTFEFVRVTGKTNNAAAVAEATQAADDAVYGTPDAGKGAKPESAMTFEVASTPVETIAHLMPITRRAAADAPQARAMVDAFLLYGLEEEEEDQLINGNGTSPNLSGILDHTGISTVGSSGTDIDAIVDAIRTIRLDNREPTGMVIHPNDWYSTGFLLAKNTAGNYIIGDPSRPLDAMTALWGLRVVVTPAMTENTVLVGDFKQAVIGDRQQSAIYVTDSHKDWFGRNLLAVLAEKRIAFELLDEDAFCTVTAV